ncbi:hypothetical protein XENOCAPTIV_004406, partial [Xenoophorus captivus]
YDALLKRKSQTDLDVAPLKVKERNNCSPELKDGSISSDDTKLTTRSKQRKEIITMLNLSDATRTDTFNTSCSQAARFSPERSHKVAMDTTAALRNTSRPRPGFCKPGFPQICHELSVYQGTSPVSTLHLKYLNLLDQGGRERGVEAWGAEVVISPRADAVTPSLPPEASGGQRVEVGVWSVGCSHPEISSIIGASRMCEPGHP